MDTYEVELKLWAAQQAFDATRAYMAERKAFGKSIDQFQALQFRLADMEIELQSARIFLRQAAWKLDNGAADATHFCAMAKKLVTDMGSKVANDCLQLHGGYGYLAGFTDNSMRQVAAEPHATAHCETVQKADDRLMAGREFGVEAVFIGPK